MSYVKALDVSKYQGVINWPAVKQDGYEIAIIKMSGGDDGLYYDSKATTNYYGAKAAGIAVGMYHFAGGTDAASEADYFVRACSPLEENDVLVLDWETTTADPVAWCDTFITRVHDLTGVWPLVYMNGSTRNSRDWSTVFNKAGAWIAWYDKDPNGDLPVTGPYIMHQYTSSGTVSGIAGNVDLDAWFDSVDTFKKYGYHGPSTAPATQPVVVNDPVLPAPVQEKPAETTQNEPVVLSPGDTVQPNSSPDAHTTPSEPSEPQSGTSDHSEDSGASQGSYEGQSGFKITRYSKFIVAAVGALGTWFTASITDGRISAPELGSLVMAVLTALGVYQVKNK